MPAFPARAGPQPALLQPQQMQKQQYQQVQMKTVRRLQHVRQHWQYPQPIPGYQQQTMCFGPSHRPKPSTTTAMLPTVYVPLVQVARPTRLLVPPVLERRVFIRTAQIHAEAKYAIILEAAEAKKADFERKRVEAIWLKQESHRKKTEIERSKHEAGEIAPKKAQEEEAERIAAEKIAPSRGASKESTASTCASESFTSSGEEQAAVADRSHEDETVEEEPEVRSMYVECLHLATKLEEEELRGDTSIDSAGRRAEFVQILALYDRFRVLDERAASTIAAPSCSQDSSAVH